MVTKKASKSGARRVTAQLDAIASLFQDHHASLGIPQKVAADFATRCDMLSDKIDSHRQAGYFDPAQIGEGVPGPLVMDPNNPFMAGEFTQEKFTQLAAQQMSGELAANAAKHIAEPKLASQVGKAVYASSMAMLAKIAKGAAKVAGEEPAEDEKDADEKEEVAAKKTAARAAEYNRIRREAAKKADEDGDAEEEAKEEVEEGEKPEEDAEEEAKKTAALFKLFS